MQMQNPIKNHISINANDNSSITIHIGKEKTISLLVCKEQIHIEFGEIKFVYNINPINPTNKADNQLPTHSKKILLEKLKKEAENCKSCELCKTRKNCVFGEGDIDAQLMLIGEAPGATEDEQGLPFVGRAGQLLSELLKEIGIDRKEIYIANCLKCRPPNNRDPLESELNACRPFLNKQIELIKPQVIVTLGRFAMMELLGSDKKISQCRGQLFTVGDYIVIPTYHPAYLLRNPKAIEVFIEDLSKVKTLI